MDNSGGFDYLGDGTSVAAFHGIPVIAAPATDLQDSDKLLYASLMMSRNHLQQIIDNKHLFDLQLVNAAHLVLNRYDTTRIENNP